MTALRLQYGMEHQADRTFIGSDRAAVYIPDDYMRHLLRGHQ